MTTNERYILRILLDGNEVDTASANTKNILDKLISDNNSEMKDQGYILKYFGELHNDKKSTTTITLSYIRRQSCQK